MLDILTDKAISAVDEYPNKRIISTTCSLMPLSGS
jgi:hypothetical protein